jgi:hypothetical protein
MSPLAFFNFYPLFCFCIFLLLCSSLFPPTLMSNICSTFLMPFMLCAYTAFHYVAPLLYSFSLLTTTFYAHASVPKNHILCMSLSCQVLCQIILATLCHHNSFLHLNSMDPLLCSACHIFSQFSPRSSSQLCHFTGGYSMSIHHQCSLS